MLIKRLKTEFFNRFKLNGGLLLGSGLVRNSFLVFCAMLIVQITQFLLNLFFARHFGPELFGVFKTIIYLFTFLPILIELGTNFTMTRYIAEFGHRNRGKIAYLIKWFLKLRIVLYISLLSVILTFKDYIAVYFLGNASLAYIVIPGMVIAGSTFLLVFHFIVMGYQNFRLYSLSKVLWIVLTAVFAIPLSYFGMYYALIGWSFGYLSVLIYWKFLSKRDIFGKSKRFDVKRIFRNYSIPIYLLNIPTALPAVIVPILSLFFSQLYIGYYAFAFMFYFLGLLIPGTLALVLFPKVSELNGLKKHGEAKDTLKKALGMHTLVVIPGLIAVFFLSEWFVSIIAPAYLPGLFMFKVIVSLGLLLGYIAIYIAYLNGLGRVKGMAMLTLLQNGLLFIVSLELLSLFGGQ